MIPWNQLLVVKLQLASQAMRRHLETLALGQVVSRPFVRELNPPRA